MEDKGVSQRPCFGELSDEQKEKLRQFKIKTRLDNERYLRAHPDKLILNKPTNIREFAAGEFCFCLPERVRVRHTLMSNTAIWLSFHLIWSNLGSIPERWESLQQQLSC
uniref:Uncharacterized protein n=1 Tax=Nothobranchius furzeri TaxID=105023 RepID=A0A8C6NSZ9_NOTFU